MTTIRPARFPADTVALLDIWREFVASPAANLDFQNNDAEFASLPGKYALPDGCVLLAEKGNDITGCIAFRQVSASICEMKRLYVRRQARESGLGRRLVEALIVAARHAGYAEMRLDVLAEFLAAQRLYAEMGFVAAAPVSPNPLPGTLFLGLRLDRPFTTAA